MIVSGELKKEFASEGGTHWYQRDGTPCHEQPCKSRPGEFRPTTLKDARAQNLLPSVSGILKVMDQPGLKRWRDRQIAEASLIYGVHDDATIEEALAFADERMSVARDKGSAVHGAIEEYFREYKRATDHPRDTYDVSVLRYPAYSAHIKAAIHALDELGVVGLPFRSERSFSSLFWGFGGCTDYVTQSSSEDIVVDFKIVTTLDKKMDYWDRAAQIAAYMKGLDGSITRGANVFISSETAEYQIREWDKEELTYGWTLFSACLELWKVVNRFDPAIAHRKSD